MSRCASDLALRPGPVNRVRALFGKLSIFQPIDIEGDPGDHELDDLRRWSFVGELNVIGGPVVAAVHVTPTLRPWRSRAVQATNLPLQGLSTYKTRCALRTCLPSTDP